MLIILLSAQKVIGEVSLAPTQHFAILTANFPPPPYFYSFLISKITWIFHPILPGPRLLEVLLFLSSSTYEAIFYNNAVPILRSLI